MARLATVTDCLPMRLSPSRPRPPAVPQAVSYAAFLVPWPIFEMPFQWARLYADIEEAKSGSQRLRSTPQAGQWRCFELHLAETVAVIWRDKIPLPTLAHVDLLQRP